MRDSQVLSICPSCLSRLGRGEQCPECGVRGERRLAHTGPKKRPNHAYPRREQYTHRGRNPAYV